MDTTQGRSEVSYEENPARPWYPTPPPSFSYDQLHADEYSEYTNSYSDSPLSPSPFSTDSYLQDSYPFDFPTSPPRTSELPINDDDMLAISTVFHPGAVPAPNTMVSSRDGVIFYVDFQTILKSCPTSFKAYLNGSLSDPQYRTTLIPLDAPSTELNIILHTLYGSSPAAHSPDIETLVCAVDRMTSYSISPLSLIRPSTPLHDLLLAYAPRHPLEVYALSAHHGLSSLAVTVSSYLLSYDLATITDEMAERIGAVSMHKLLRLHAGRFASLKEILIQPPNPHPPTEECNFEDKRKLTRAWALVTAYLAWDPRPDPSSHSMQSAFNPLLGHLTCELCHQALKDRIKDVVIRWVSVKRTI
ncbi:hypothetical protein GALMADRAFT_253611 [Galerina marginata CBS 339.88]|uniref:Uncharacterized protein n=1 Tax=Galerina marginata (strain CBS 339.88) TaxID=685588 RepID=A0A067SLM2_GALM3|nr:hypothetical protein GALMADRAFT_253611 [Galerina marginata CBS 339.88]